MSSPRKRGPITANVSCARECSPSLAQHGHWRLSVPARAEPVIGRRLAPTHWLGRDDEIFPYELRSRSLQHFPRVHDAERVEHRLDGTHQLDRDLVFHLRQFIALEHADAVLGGNRSGHPQHDVEYHRIDLVPARKKIRRVAANGLADIIMDIAVAEMAERHRPRARYQLYYRGIGLFDEIRHRGDRHRNVVLDRAAFWLLRSGHFIAQLPERHTLAEVCRNHGVID